MVNYLHILWSGPLVIGLCIFFLWQILGIAALTGLVTMIVLVPLNGIIATRLRALTIKQMKTKDERLKMMNEILGGIKVCYFSFFISLVQNKSFLLKLRNYVVIISF